MQTRLEENMEAKSHKKIRANLWDFDNTLTKTYVRDWKKGDEPSQEDVKFNLKNGVVESFRYTWNQDGHNAIISNGSKSKITHYLNEAGFTVEEIEKIKIFAANSAFITYGFKKDAVKSLQEMWLDADDFYFYDDKKTFQIEVSTLIDEFKLKNKSLTIVPVSKDEDNHDHILFAQNKIPLPTEVLSKTEKPLTKIEQKRKQALMLAEIKTPSISTNLNTRKSKPDPSTLEKFCSLFICCHKDLKPSKKIISKELISSATSPKHSSSSSSLKS